MKTITLGESESKFAELVWQCEPVLAAELAKTANCRYGWKTTTSYTMLKRLCEKGLFQNTRGLVTAVVSRADYYAHRSASVVQNDFCGSLPAFIAAFTKHNSLTKKEAAQIKKLIKDAVEK